MRDDGHAVALTRGRAGRRHASGGGYYEGNPTRLLAEEMAGCAAAGFKAVKMKIGKGSAEEDRERVRATREAIGPGVELIVDAVNAWSDPKHAIKVARMIEEYDIRKRTPDISFAIAWNAPPRTRIVIGSTSTRWSSGGPGCFPSSYSRYSSVIV